MREIHNEEHINVRLDSIHVVDSIFIYTKGDTVYETRFRDRWRYRIINDTVWLADTIPKIVTVEVERPLSFFDSIKLKTWSCFAVIIFIWCIIFIIKKRFGAL